MIRYFSPTTDNDDDDIMPLKSFPVKRWQQPLVDRVDSGQVLHAIDQATSKNKPHAD
jgi:hypothetical protein